MNSISKSFAEHLTLVQQSALSMPALIVQAGDMILNAKRIFTIGNGGSSSDSAHFSAELTGRFETERRPLSCIALTADSATLTAVGNDFGFRFVFSRQIEAHGEKNDVLIAISTSGNSSNILKAIETAKRIGMKTIALTGNDGGQITALAPDLHINVPHSRTCRVQEVHGLVLHLICQHIDERCEVLS